MIKPADKTDPRLEAVFGELKIQPDQTVALAGDASARRFFRLRNFRGRESSSILIIFPSPFKEDIRRYRGVASALHQAGLPVPEIYRADEEAGFILTEDCGDLLLEKAAASFSPDRFVPLYIRALDLLITMQTTLTPQAYPDCPALQFSFTAEQFRWELDFFRLHTLVGFYGAVPTGGDKTTLDKFFNLLAAGAVNQPAVFTHRDYHSRNLLIDESENDLRIIDYQDARIGPYTYDLVSILYDPYVNLKEETREQLFLYYYRSRPRTAGKISLDRFHRDCDMMSLQRLLKAAGTYGYMTVEKNRGWYGKHLPAVFKTVKKILEKYPELRKPGKIVEKYTKEIRNHIF